MADDPRTLLRRLIAAHLAKCCPACAGVDAGGTEAQHIREPEAEYLAGRLLELFPDIYVRREWHSDDDGWIVPAEIVPAGATHVRFELCTTATPIAERTTDADPC